MVVIIVGLLAFLAGIIVGREIAVAGLRRVVARRIRDLEAAHLKAQRAARATGDVMQGQRLAVCPHCDEEEVSATVNTEA